MQLSSSFTQLHCQKGFSFTVSGVAIFEDVTNTKTFQWNFINQESAYLRKPKRQSSACTVRQCWAFKRKIFPPWNRLNFLHLRRQHISFGNIRSLLKARYPLVNVTSRWISCVLVYFRTQKPWGPAHWPSLGKLQFWWAPGFQRLRGCLRVDWDVPQQAAGLGMSYSFGFSLKTIQISFFLVPNQAAQQDRPRKTLLVCRGVTGKQCNSNVVNPQLSWFSWTFTFPPRVCMPKYNLEQLFLFIWFFFFRNWFPMFNALVCNCFVSFMQICDRFANVLFRAPLQINPTLYVAQKQSVCVVGETGIHFRQNRRFFQKNELGLQDWSPTRVSQRHKPVVWWITGTQSMPMTFCFLWL